MSPQLADPRAVVGQPQQPVRRARQRLRRAEEDLWLSGVSAVARVGREVEPVLRGLHARTRMLGIRNACDDGWPICKMCGIGKVERANGALYSG